MTVTVRTHPIPVKKPIIYSRVVAYPILLIKKKKCFSPSPLLAGPVRFFTTRYKNVVVARYLACFNSMERRVDDVVSL